MSEKRAPTPWVRENKRLYSDPSVSIAGSVLDAQGNTVCVRGFALATGGEPGVPAANTDLIIDAVNSYAALVAERDALKETLEIASGILAVVAADAPWLRIKFTGKWEHLGTLTVSEALDKANAALEPKP